MSQPAIAGRPSLTIRGTRYPILLPTIRDPRLHLAAVIVTLQVLGQTSFGFNLSIAQILVALATSALLEVGIAFRRQKVLMWPASALLTGNGVAFILRVPGTEHGDWWSMNGWWIFALTSAVALLSKYVVQFRGRHIFNPSNFGLVLCFLALGPERADPLAFWWGPLSPALVLAIVLIVAGGFAILGRLHLTHIAVGFWISFAAGIAVLAASGHTMTAAWHVGPIEGADFWWTLVSSPEILVFLFFMITDPRTIPESPRGRWAYAVGVGLLATLLIAPFTTEFAAKVAVLGALFVVCAARPVLLLLGSSPAAERALGAVRSPGKRLPLRPRARAGAAALAGVAVFAGLVFVAGIPARPEPASASAATLEPGQLPEITVLESDGVAAIDRGTAASIARDIVLDLQDEADALHRRDPEQAATAATGTWLAELWAQIRAAGDRELTVPSYAVESVRVRLVPGEGQGPPVVEAQLAGTVVAESTSEIASGEPEVFRRTVQLVLERGRYKIASSQGGMEPLPSTAPPPPAGTEALGGTSFENVAAKVGLDFRQGSFRFGVSNDTTAMMGGGLCWLDYDRDGWLDLFAVNSYAQTDIATWEERGGLPRSALFRNTGGGFDDVSRASGADLQLRGNGCVAADFDLDGYTDLYVTTAGFNVPTNGYDALLWNNGDGTFTEGAQAAGINSPGWHAGTAVGDVNGDGRPDLFVASYTDPNAQLPSASGFPTNHRAVRDLLYLNEGADPQGRTTFREVGRRAGIEPAGPEHGLGTVFTDVDGDGRLDLYVANDEDPNQLYRNVRVPGGLGFRFEEVGRELRVDDPNAGMGIAAADFDGDARGDLFVTNSRGQLHAVYRGPGRAKGSSFTDARPEFTAAVGTHSTGWGASWADLDLDGDLDLVLANGAIPVTDLARNAQHVQVIENIGKPGGPERFASVGARVGAQRVARVNGRGLAAADFDNDGDIDVAVNSIGGRLILLRNDAPKRRWLEVRLDAFAPGTVVTATLPDGRRLVREVHAGSSYLSSEDPRVHFGLGNATRVRELRVRFPDGREVVRKGLVADRIVAVG